jgi:hypothetical protein
VVEVLVEALELLVLAPVKQEVLSPVTVTCYYKERGLKLSRLSQRRNKTYSSGPLLIIGPIVKSNHNGSSGSDIDCPVEVVTGKVAQVKATTQEQIINI